MTREMMARWMAIQRKVSGMGPADTPHHAAPWAPNTDVYEGTDTLIVKMELAGVPCEAIRITLEDRVLRVGGERPDPYCRETMAGYRIRQMEVDYGEFERLIPLPYAVDGEKATARCQGGVLEIRLPRSAHDRDHRVTIVMET